MSEDYDEKEAAEFGEEEEEQEVTEEETRDQFRARVYKGVPRKDTPNNHQIKRSG